MNECERIARTLAKRKAKELYGHHHHSWIPSYVESHYWDYLGTAEQALEGRGQGHVTMGWSLPERFWGDICTAIWQLAGRGRVAALLLALFPGIAHHV